jgi:hypothetical protein
MNRSLLALCLLLAACTSTQTDTPVIDVITPLEQACLRDPLDPENWERLAAALSVAGQRERAASMYLQGASLRQHAVQQDYVTLKQAVSEFAMPRTQVRRLGPALVEVLRSDDQATSTLVRLEISNGNGVTGAAARLARSLETASLKTVRLSNMRPFVEARSRIEYPRQQQAMAQALGRRLKLPLLPLQQQRSGPAYADLRIVLGHDVRYLK